MNGRSIPIWYKTRDIGYGIEEGTLLARPTDEVDMWGKQTVLVSHDGGKTWVEWYLFPDEWGRG
jgi:hypothetical protein